MKCKRIQAAASLLAACILLAAAPLPVLADGEATDRSMATPETAATAREQVELQETERLDAAVPEPQTPEKVSAEETPEPETAGQAELPSPLNDASAIAIDETTFPDAAFRAYVASRFDSDDDGYLSETEANSSNVVDLYSAGIHNVASLQGIEYLTGLMGLDASGNQLTEVDLSRNTRLMQVFLEENQLTSLTLGQNEAMIELWAYGNLLTELDVSGVPSLQTLYLDNNQLTHLDLSHNSNLQAVFVNENSLSGLTFGQSNDFQLLSAYNNQLTAVDLSGLPGLVGLDLSGNLLTALDLSGNDSLVQVYANGNALTSLILGEQPQLEELYVADNRLESLNVSAAPALGILSAANNSLSSVDLTHNAALEELYLFGNPLVSVDLTGCTGLTVSLLTPAQAEAYLAEQDANMAETFTALGMDPALRADAAHTIVLPDNGAVDLSCLPGFDPTRASNWRGGTVEGTVLTPDEGATVVSYDYKLGNGQILTLTLQLKAAEEETPVEPDPKPEDPGQQPDPEQPGEPEPETPDQPADPDQPSDPVQPVEPVQPQEPAGSAGEGSDHPEIADAIANGTWGQPDPTAAPAAPAGTAATIPQTGDPLPLAAILTAMLVGAAGTLGLIFWRKYRS